MFCPHYHDDLEPAIDASKPAHYVVVRCTACGETVSWRKTSAIDLINQVIQIARDLRDK